MAASYSYSTGEENSNGDPLSKETRTIFLEIGGRSCFVSASQTLPWEETKKDGGKPLSDA